MKKRGFLVVAHGSKKAEANDRVFALVSELKEYFQTDLFEPAFMEMAKPLKDRPSQIPLAPISLANTGRSGLTIDTPAMAMNRSPGLMVPLVGS